jgi:hypothetical protein
VNAHDTSHELFEQLAVGHALNALEPEDEQTFLKHLLGCAPCERAVAEHLETLTHLAFGASSPELLPASILEGIRAGITDSGRAGSFPVSAGTAPVSLDAARVRRRDRTVRFTTAVLGAAASIVLVAALVFVNQGLKAKEHNAKVNAAQLNTVVNSLLVSGSRKIDLHGSDGRRGVVVMHGNKASLVVAGVPANDPRNSVYVLWEKYGTKVEPIKTFDLTSSEATVIDNVNLGAGASTLSQFVITREQGRVAPAEGSHQPAVVSGNA